MNLKLSLLLLAAISLSACASTSQPRVSPEFGSQAISAKAKFDGEFATLGMINGQDGKYEKFALAEDVSLWLCQDASCENRVFLNDFKGDAQPWTYQLLPSETPVIILAEVQSFKPGPNIKETAPEQETKNIECQKSASFVLAQGGQYVVGLDNPESNRSDCSLSIETADAFKVKVAEIERRGESFPAASYLYFSSRTIGGLSPSTNRGVER